MNWGSWLIWGAFSTVLLTTIMAASQMLGLSRMDIPYLLGTLFTPNRDRAKIYGVLLHVFNGWVFSLLYVAAFHAAHLFTWWFGAALGLVHGAFVLLVTIPSLPGLHPRMASELHGPTVVQQLEPPGFLARNYGVGTPAVTMVAHLVFGAVLGAMYAG